MPITAWLPRTFWMLAAVRNVLEVLDQRLKKMKVRTNSDHQRVPLDELEQPAAAARPSGALDRGLTAGRRPRRAGSAFGRRRRRVDAHEATSWVRVGHLGEPGRVRCRGAAARPITRPWSRTMTRSDTCESSSKSLVTTSTEQPWRHRLADEVVDLGPGVHVDALGGLVEQQHLGVAAQPPGQDDLLLVAARQRAHLLVLRRRPDEEPADGVAGVGVGGAGCGGACPSSSGRPWPRSGSPTGSGRGTRPRRRGPRGRRRCRRPWPRRCGGSATGDPSMRDRRPTGPGRRRRPSSAARSGPTRAGRRRRAPRPCAAGS